MQYTYRVLDGNFLEILNSNGEVVDKFGPWQDRVGPEQYGELYTAKLNSGWTPGADEDSE